MKQRIWLGIACRTTLLVATASAAAADATLQLLPSPLTLPIRIGPMTYTGAPHEFENPALGTSYQYGGNGLSLTVYIYDGGESNLADGADTVPACLQFEIAKSGVVQSYQKAQLKAEQLVRLNPPDDLPQMREAHYEYEREGNATISFVWITTVARHFVKLRLSLNPRWREELPEARRAVLDVIGESIEPHLAPATPKAEAPAGSDESIELKARYLMLLNKVAERSPDLAPVCGGEFVPGFETELRIYREMFGRGQGLARTRLGKDIRRIDKAGFLEEFLWVDRHRETWGPIPPEGMALSEYTGWRAKKLKQFNAPDFGTVTIDHPRPLPLEPASP